MPWSDNIGKDRITAWLKGHQVASMVDFGAGAGYYGRLLRCLYPSARTTAVEIYRPYVAEYGLHELYTEVLVDDMRHMDLPHAQLAILGDVVEHLPAADAAELLQRVAGEYQDVIIKVPLGHYPQGPWGGNRYEAHRSEWSMHALASLLPDFAVQEDCGGAAVFIKQA